MACINKAVFHLLLWIIFASTKGTVQSGCSSYNVPEKSTVKNWESLSGIFFSFTLTCKTSLFLT
ncbi:hypothetical protein I79_012773 [Cricetulus griseus]|uniref:Uncharacterized protein n=1 Tax=Cricetulus griseus TaxID=10029 RepID=G3HPQ6_CRIGR|nr:hypothetical protein I79_012773 [Cricetulus griseus]